MHSRTTSRFPRCHVAVVVLASAALLVSILTVARTGSARAATTSAGGWAQIFRDDFSGSAGTGADADWLYDVGTGYPGGAAQWGTGEVETASSSRTNVYQDGYGHLVIRPLRSAQGTWTSGRIETQRTDFAAPVGGELTMTASIRQPDPTSGLGYWPAFWALGAAARPVAAADWPGVGELDVMEDVNGLSQVSHTFHCGVWGQPPCNEPNGISSGLLACALCQTHFHSYSVTIDRRNPAAEQLRFSTDGVEQYRVDESAVGTASWSAAVDHGFFLILDVAIGGSYPDKVCACTSTATPPVSGAPMTVDYVSVSRFTPASPAPTSSAAPSVTPSMAPSMAPSVATSSSSSATPVTGVIQAEAFTAQQGVRVQPTADVGGGSDVGWIGNGDQLRYDNVDFGSSSLSQFTARVASGAAPGVSGLLDVHLDTPGGPLIGSIAVANTGSWQDWRTMPANITPTSGVHTVYLSFVSGSAADFVNVNWFQFTR